MSRRQARTARAQLLAVWLLWLGAAAGSSQAQEANAVYRCGDGRYSQTPCPGGTRLQVEAAPTPQQQREAQQTAERERRLADQLRAERHAREKAATAGAPARIGPPASAASKPAKAASQAHEHKKKRKKRDDALHNEPASRRAYAPKAKEPPKD